jgi:hypothetical protein
MSEPMETARITIVRVIDEDGEMAVRVIREKQFSATELLGMLAIAQQQIYQDIDDRRRRDEH